MTVEAPRRWLLLMHQIPHKPAYLRVKVGRRLLRVGAVGLKSSVYALPHAEGLIEDLQWIRREILEGGGDATIVEAELIEGLSDDQVEGLFRAARDADYSTLIAEARGLHDRLEDAETLPGSVEADLARLEKRLDEISAIDFFGAPQRETAAGLIEGLRSRLDDPERTPSTEVQGRPHGRVWVTRSGVHVDRIASAWLIRRFIDPEAEFKFVPPKGYVPRRGELRFDMYEAEYTHEGNRCTFETLCRRFAVDQPGLNAIAEMVHDIDIKDGAYGRLETPGLAAVIAGIGLVEREDDQRLRRGFELFDALLAASGRKKDKGTK
jgi:hypothetical protein